MGRSKSKKSTGAAAEQSKKAKEEESNEVEEQEEEDEEEEEGEEEGEEDDYEEDDDEEEIELLKVDTGDVVKMKQVLDESVAGTFLDMFLIRENHFVDNLKLAVMTIACSFAAVAQFAPMNFPDSRPMIGVCCVLYFVFSGILQIVTTLWDKDAIMVTKPVSEEEMKQDLEAKKKRIEEDFKKAQEDGSNKRKPNAAASVEEELHPPPSITNQEMHKFGLRIRTALPRYSEYYTVVIQFQSYKNEAGKEAPSPFVQKTWSVGQFFDKEGNFDEMGLMEEMEDLYTQFASAKYDKEAKRDEHLAAGFAKKKKAGMAACFKGKEDSMEKKEQ